MCQHKNFAKSSYVDAFFNNFSSAAAARATTAKAVIQPEAAAEAELGKNVST